ncbi:hypothetical protein KMW28_23610 [Flammeovirga yaeyamensis]|uniref:Gylcosyl hydrolase 115 C-terminal domain-containing protein n=1 Tax=Flammeovirga yaeyamensis TaxID=367791 RepID=A0AAX1NCT5_9BACT|nr:hypothetical protein [Flammeovirga yaeyamensis]MBB3696640.1 hypothetical protein [Flammeovirga yaeyamensis]NMF33313.1 hypothetical protein [Flammeovirga yaeyamensis]QWG05409.1 hypothetical protein KMW28_23610 [Flammeovirga yaeyamensis]
MKLQLLIFLFLIGTSCTAQIDIQDQAVRNKKFIFEEKDGIVAVEAEHFYKQGKNEIRAWFQSDSISSNDLIDEGVKSASKNKYIQILPDTRVTHDDEVVRGENFTNTPGQIGILHYKVKFNETGRYYVWVRAFSTGSEDNGIHVGLDGEWPVSGKKMQWSEGRNEWTWASKQRTKEEHCGIPYGIYLDIETEGVHDIQFSMREDGFRFDKFLLTKDSLYTPKGKDIEEVISRDKSLRLP